MTNVDAERLGQLLGRVEVEIHRTGWDGPASLWLLYDARDLETDRAYREVVAVRRGPAIRCQPYAAQLAVPTSLLDGNPAHALFRFALNVTHGGEHPAVQSVVEMIRQPGFLGLAFAVEAWMRVMDSQEERDALGDVRFADLPGSIEVRNVMAADVAGNDYYVQRRRGEKPQVHRTGVGDMGDMGGSIPESLRAIVAVVAGLPVPEIVNHPSQWNWNAERGSRASSVE